MFRPLLDETFYLEEFMNTKLDEILTQALLEIDNATTFLKLNEIRAFYTGKKSPLAEIMKTLSNATIEDKKELVQHQIM